LAVTTAVPRRGRVGRVRPRPPLKRPLSRDQLMPGGGPRSRSLWKPRALAPAAVPGPVVGFGSFWADPNPHRAADPDPPPGMGDCPVTTPARIDDECRPCSTASTPASNARS
jgi:hypothetical protein